MDGVTMRQSGIANKQDPQYTIHNCVNAAYLVSLP